jgi:hypothetical protein
MFHGELTMAHRAPVGGEGWLSPGRGNGRCAIGEQGPPGVDKALLFGDCGRGIQPL